MKSFSYTKSIPSLVILLQHSLQVRSLVEYLSCKLRVGDNLPVSVVLQGTGTDIQPLAHFLTRKEKFSGEERLVRFCHFQVYYFRLFLFPPAKIMAYVDLSKQQGTVGKYREQ